MNRSNIDWWFWARFCFETVPLLNAAFWSGGTSTGLSVHFTDKVSNFGLLNTRRQYFSHTLSWTTMVPEVFLDFSPRERAAKRRKIEKNLWDQGSQGRIQTLIRTDSLKAGRPKTIPGKRSYGHIMQARRKANVSFGFETICKAILWLPNVFVHFMTRYATFRGSRLATPPNKFAWQVARKGA